MALASVPRSSRRDCLRACWWGSVATLLRPVQWDQQWSCRHRIPGVGPRRCRARRTSRSTRSRWRGTVPSAKSSHVAGCDPRVARGSAATSRGSSSSLVVSRRAEFSLGSLTFAGLGRADGGDITKTSLGQAGRHIHLRLSRSSPALPVGAPGSCLRASSSRAARLDWQRRPRYGEPVSPGPRRPLVGWTAIFRPDRPPRHGAGGTSSTCSQSQASSVDNRPFGACVCSSSAFPGVDGIIDAGHCERLGLACASESVPILSRPSEKSEETVFPIPALQPLFQCQPSVVMLCFTVFFVAFLMMQLNFV